MSRRRLFAIAAIVLAVATIALAVVVSVQAFLRGIWPLLCIVVAVAAAWYGVVRRGAARAAGLGVAALGIAGALVLVVTGDRLVEGLVIFAGALLAIGAAREAFVVHATLPAAPAPKRPVLFYNPKSGGGKAERFHLAREARERGFESVELARGDDLESLVRDAVERGADGLAAAGGDGTQAIVAAIASELDLPFACIPAGTRNHFALDLGVDREDVVGALDAFVDGGERRVDLADVNGRVFVNNVSLGLYADAVQRPGYREAKIKTLLDAMPDALGPGAQASGLVWSGPSGAEVRGGVAILVSNNAYRLGHTIGSGMRPRMDDGELGIAVLETPQAGGPSRGHMSSPMWQWTSPEFRIDATEPVAAGIDGEAVKLDPPLRFQTLPGALRVRISRQHPGCSPALGAPNGTVDAVRALLQIAVGH
jgi:diacylglycerol kinase family enzyme